MMSNPNVIAVRELSYRDLLDRPAPKPLRGERRTVTDVDPVVPAASAVNASLVWLRLVARQGRSEP